MNDREALEKLRQAGKQRSDAVTYLYRRYAPRFLAYYLRHRLSRRDAEALVEDAFVAIARQREDFFGEVRADAWLWAGARSALLDHFRRQRPQEIADDHPLELLVGDSAPGAAAPTAAGASAAECAREAYSVFAAAHADRAEMLARVAFDGWSIDDVAAALRRSADATRAYIDETREKLNAYLEPCREPGRLTPAGTEAEGVDAGGRGWLDALAGGPPGAEAALAAVKEGAVVREAMLASRRTPPRLDADAGLRRVLARLRAENLLERARLPFGWKVPAVAAAAALAVVLVLALREPPRRGPPRPPAPEVPVLSGDPGVAQAIVTPDAREIADEVQTAMTEAGLTPAVTHAGALTRLEADWPRRPSAAQIEFLRNYGFARPNGPQLKVEVRPPQE